VGRAGRCFWGVSAVPLMSLVGLRGVGDGVLIRLFLVAGELPPGSWWVGYRVWGCTARLLARWFVLERSGVGARGGLCLSSVLPSVLLTGGGLLCVRLFMEVRLAWARLTELGAVGSYSWTHGGSALKGVAYSQLGLKWVRGVSGCIWTEVLLRVGALSVVSWRYGVRKVGLCLCCLVGCAPSFGVAGPARGGSEWWGGELRGVCRATRDPGADLGGRFYGGSCQCGGRRGRLGCAVRGRCRVGLGGGGEWIFVEFVSGSDRAP